VSLFARARAMAFGFSDLSMLPSFPRKRESRGERRVLGHWIPASAGMTEERNTRNWRRLGVPLRTSQGNGIWVLRPLYVAVVPAQAGIQGRATGFGTLDSRLRGNDRGEKHEELEAARCPSSREPGQWHLGSPTSLLPSFPRKRESRGGRRVSGRWIPACAGMTEEPNAIAPIEGAGEECSLQLPRACRSGRAHSSRFLRAP
jgi:hypothetical protein